MMCAFLGSGNLLDALDVGADGRQLGFHAVVAAVEVVDAVDQRLAAQPGRR
jgi:hypothetical protein